MAEENDLKQIPYGVADFDKFRKKNYYYVDKTRYSRDEKFKKAVGHTILKKVVLIFCGTRLESQSEV